MTHSRDADLVLHRVEMGYAVQPSLDKEWESLNKDIYQ
jgi:hypothetical protein